VGKNSSIEWTNHTFNPWWGCTKVSPACAHCYAEAWAKRVGSRVWGEDAPRRFFGDAHWRNPLRWNDEAERKGNRARVFCASMADVFEERDELAPHRSRLWELIDKTPNLDWLLLTKRPHAIATMAPWGHDWPSHIWLGTTIENQRQASKRLPYLLNVPAKVRFISCEPLLGPIHISTDLKRGIHWVIAGGESGANARPSHPDWFRSLRDQCQATSVAFHFKQWGNWVPAEGGDERALSVRIKGKVASMTRTSKKDASRLLDHRQWDELPGA